MAHGQWKRVDSTADRATVMGVALPKTTRNFNGGARDPWASDGEVVAGCNSAGVGNLLAYSFPMPRGGNAPAVFVHGGGHNNGCDGSLFKFDLLAAAASINASGSGGQWTIATPTGLLLAGKDAKPAGTFQNAGSPDTPFLWTTKNAKGQQRLCAAHAYATDMAPPNLSKVILSGYFCGCAACNATSSPNAFEVYDETDGTSTLIQALNGTAVMSGGWSVSLAGGAHVGAVPVYNDQDGNVYVETPRGSQGSATQLSRYANPFTNPSQTILIGLNVYCASDSGSQCSENPICQDPVAGVGSPVRDMFFDNDDTIGHPNAVLAVDIGGRPLLSSLTWTNDSLPFTTPASVRSFGCDSNDGSLWAWGGDRHIFHIVLNSRTSMTVSEPITNYTGSPPAGFGRFFRMTYDSTHDAIIAAGLDAAHDSVAVYVYKP